MFAKMESDNVHRELRRNYLHEMVALYIDTFHPPLKPRPLSMKNIANSIRGKTTTHQIINFVPNRPKRQIKCKHCYKVHGVRRDTTYCCSVCGSDDAPVGLCHPSTDRKCFDEWELHKESDPLLHVFGFTDSEDEFSSESGNSVSNAEPSNSPPPLHINFNNGANSVASSSVSPSQIASTSPPNVSSPKPSPSNRRQRSKKRSSDVLDLSVYDSRTNKRKRKRQKRNVGNGTLSVNVNMDMNQSANNEHNKEYDIILFGKKVNVKREIRWLSEYFERHVMTQGSAVQIAGIMQDDGFDIGSEELRSIVDHMRDRRVSNFSLWKDTISYRPRRG